MPQWPAFDPVDTPLSDAELDRLSELLERHAVPHGGMSLEMLDGFLSALVVGPELVAPAEYLPEVWGPDAPGAPTEEEAHEAHALIARLWNGIVRRVRIAPEDQQSVHMPILLVPAEAPAEDDTGFELGKEWAMGFIGGVGLREDAWNRWEQELEWVAEDLAELSVLAGYEIDPPEPLTYAEREAMVAEVPEILHALNGVRLQSLAPAPVRAEPVPGRNDPCPCGSGRKFKKCCGAPPTLH